MKQAYFMVYKTDSIILFLHFSFVITEHLLRIIEPFSGFFGIGMILAGSGGLCYDKVYQDKGGCLCTER